MKTNRSLTPRLRRNTLAARVMDYLQANPDEELTRHDVATKFTLPAAAVDGLLADAINAGMGRVLKVYRAGVRPLLLQAGGRRSRVT